MPLFGKIKMAGLRCFFLSAVGLDSATRSFCHRLSHDDDNLTTPSDVLRTDESTLTSYI